VTGVVQNLDGAGFDNAYRVHYMLVHSIHRSDCYSSIDYEFSRWTMNTVTAVWSKDSSPVSVWPHRPHWTR